jgi:hypothetical protein
LDVYLIIGNSNTRKSSVVRSLTGCFNRSVRDVALHGGKGAVRLYARAGALQETRTTADDFLAEAARTRCAAVLCCLLPSANPNDPEAFPQAQGYISSFEAAGWRIRAVAVLGQNDGDVRHAHARQFTQAPTTPINLTARDVRLHFGWE